MKKYYHSIVNSLRKQCKRNEDLRLRYVEFSRNKVADSKKFHLPMVRLYVAGKWYDKAVIKTYIEQLKAAGAEITHDWTITEEEDKKSDEDCARFAAFDLEGVVTSEAVVVVITDPTYAYRGTCVECGAALSHNKPVIVVSLVPDAAFNTNIFMKHSLVKHMNSFDTESILNFINKV
jgi:nucleoside 2-deoxyribosyltransferase